MLFGRKDHFAVEAMVEPGLVPPSSAWGRMRIWINEFPIGDYANSHCGLPRAKFEELARNLPTLWRQEFDDLADADLFDHLDRLLYGYRRGAEPCDDRTLQQLEEDARAYGKFGFLANWGEMFDEAGKSFIFCPDGRTVKVLLRPLQSEPCISLEAPLASVREACDEFIAWLDRQVAMLACHQERPPKMQKNSGLDAAHLLPVDKHDLPRAEVIVALGYPAIDMLLPALIVWMQDVNWPVAEVLSPFLAGIGEPLAPHLRRVFESEDHVWKYWVLDRLVDPSPPLAAAIEPHLVRMASDPSQGERDEDVDEVARRILAKRAT